MPTDSNPPPTVDALLRVVAERDAEVAQLRLQSGIVVGRVKYT